MTDLQPTFQTEPLTEPKIRGWLGDKGTVVFSTSVHLPSFPGERFHVFHLSDHLGNRIGVRITDAIARLQASESRLRNALSWFVDDEECRLDHHGHCQTHGSFDDGPCPMVVAREALDQ